MTTSPSGPRARSLPAAGSVAVLVLLGAGLPLLLVGRGLTPDFRAVAQVVLHPARLGRVMGGRVDDGAALEMAVVLAWLVWAYFLGSVLLETLALAAGVRVPRLPGHRAVRAVVSGVLSATIALMPASRHASQLRLVPLTETPVQPPTMLGSASASPESPADDLVALAKERLDVTTQVPVPASVRVAERYVDSAPEEPSAADMPGAIGGSFVATGTQTYVVAPGDSLWSISEHHLGSPLRWRELAAANADRPQPGGLTLRSEQWILPGWTLVLPAEQPDARLLVGTIGYVHPTKTKSSPPAPLGDGSGRAAGNVDAASRDRRPMGLPVGPIGYGLLGAALTLTIGRARRAKGRRRSPGEPIRVPEADLVELERGLRASSDVDQLELLDLALGLLREGWDRSLGAPALEWVRSAPRAVTFSFADDPPPSVPPFRDAPHPRQWELTAERAREHEGLASTRRRRPLSEIAFPALVTVGADDRGVLLLDLERAGSLSLVGDAAPLALEAVTVELATLPWSDAVDVIVVDPAARPTGALERVRRVSEVSDLLGEMENRVATQRSLLAGQGLLRASAARWLHGGPTWDPWVVLCSARSVRQEPEAVSKLVDLAGDGSSGLVVVVEGAGCKTPWTLELGSGAVRLQGVSPTEEAGRLRPQVAPEGFVDQVDRLLETLGAQVPTSSPDVATPVDADRPLRSPDGPYDVEIRFLGPVETKGNERPFSRAWALDLVVYLAAHPSGASTDEWAAALWPDRLMAPATLHSTASAARRCLGISRDGEDHLPRAHGRLTLGPRVTSDWARFQGLARSSSEEDWKSALELVRGRPLEGLRSADWPILEGVGPTIEAAIVDLACRYAESRLSAGDPSEAEFAARRGLRASPYDERLYRILLRAADRAGNPAGVESAMAELVRLVADELEPHDAVHPETLDLYRSLSRRSSGRRSA